jgi:CheY-like chemotaxis protein
MLIIFAKHPPANLDQYLKIGEPQSEFRLLEELRRRLKEGTPRVHVPRCPNHVLLQLQFELDENKYCVVMRDIGEGVGEVFLERDLQRFAAAPGRSILIAEDREDDVLLVQHAFSKAGSQSSLQFVPDGEEALAHLRHEKHYADRIAFPFPALLLLDLKMPKKNGFEVLQEVRADPRLKKLPVIILSSSDQPNDIDSAWELGANSYLVKPSEADDLVVMLQKVEDYWLNLNRNSPLIEAA